MSDPHKNKLTGKYDWTIQTYLYLKSINFPCQLVDDLPKEGIFIAHCDNFAEKLKPTSKQLDICIKPDRAPTLYAHMHIAQNPADPVLENNHPIFKNMFVQIWPQIDLIPRDPNRGYNF